MQRKIDQIHLQKWNQLSYEVSINSMRLGELNSGAATTSWCSLSGEGERSPDLGIGTASCRWWRGGDGGGGR